MKSGRPEKNGADEVLQTALSLTMATVTVTCMCVMVFVDSGNLSQSWIVVEPSCQKWCSRRRPFYS